MVHKPPALPGEWRRRRLVPTRCVGLVNHAADCTVSPPPREAAAGAAFSGGRIGPRSSVTAAVYVFSVIPVCRVARPRAVAWPCMVTRGSKHGHATVRDRATHAKHVRRRMRRYVFSVSCVHVPRVACQPVVIVVLFSLRRYAIGKRGRNNHGLASRRTAVAGNPWHMGKGSREHIRRCSRGHVPRQGEIMPAERRLGHATRRTTFLLHRRQVHLLLESSGESSGTLCVALDGRGRGGYVGIMARLARGGSSGASESPSDGRPLGDWRVRGGPGE